MKCPHCRVEIHAGFVREFLRQASAIGKGLTGQGATMPTYWAVAWMACPSCSEAIIQLQRSFEQRGFIDGHIGTAWTVYPRAAARAPAQPEVPAALADDFNEAAAVLADSPKASAALSRRCLQGVLRSQGYTQNDLAPAIQAALDSKTLPTHVATSLDAVRNIGNFAAHPLKDKNTGAVLPVEPHEAEWNLDVLEGLFDFYFVQPAVAAAKIAALNAKIAAAGKPPIKS